jgi:F0F1-type ATP synthase assembly protein I
MAPAPYLKRHGGPADAPGMNWLPGIMIGLMAGWILPAPWSVIVAALVAYRVGTVIGGFRRLRRTVKVKEGL